MSSFSSVEELERAIRRARPGETVRLMFVAGSCTLEQAKTIYRLLQDELSPLCKVEEPSIELLRRATRHYDQLDGLQTSLELAAQDLKGRVPLQEECFGAIRAAANAVVTSARFTDSRRLLDEVTIDAQRVGRVCRGLMFGAEDIKVVDLTAADLEWLMEGGDTLRSGIDDVDVLAGLLDGDKALLVGDGGAVLPGGEGGKLLAHLDGVKARAATGGKEGSLELLSTENRFALLAGLDEDVDGEAPAGAGGEKGSPRLLDMVEVKEDTVVSLLLAKIRTLLTAIAVEKEGVLVP